MRSHTVFVNTHPWCHGIYPLIIQYISKDIHPFIMHIYKSVVLDRSPESRMRLPSTLCAALGSFSTAPLIFCVTGFVMQQTESVNQLVS